jgi:uncharacterized protein (DUF4415 family)
VAERRRTKGERRHEAELELMLLRLETSVNYWKLKERMIPREWYDVARKVPVRPRKTRVTAAYDTDLVRWFRSLGHGYQAQMNAVLRAYMLAVVSKTIEGPLDYDVSNEPI